MAKKNFILNKNGIEINTSVFSKFAFYGSILVAGLTILSCISIAFSSDKGLGAFLGILIANIIIFAVIAYIAYSRMHTWIIIDGDQQTIRKKNLYSDKIIARFDEIAALRKLNVQTGRYASNYYYTINLKTDAYGKGIAITSKHMRASHKYIINFEKDILPFINQILTAQLGVAKGAVPQPGTASDNISRPVQLGDPSSLRFYKSSAEGFYFSDIIFWSLIVGIVMFIYAVYGLYINFQGDNPFHTDGAAYKPFFLILSLYLVISACPKIITNTGTRVLSKSYLFGLINFRYPFNEFVRFTIIRKTSNLIYQGTEIRAEFKKDRLRYVVLRTFKKTTEIDAFLRETESILKS